MLATATYTCEDILDERREGYERCPSIAEMAMEDKKADLLISPVSLVKNRRSLREADSADAGLSKPSDAR